MMMDDVHQDRRHVKRDDSRSKDESQRMSNEKADINKQSDKKRETGKYSRNEADERGSRYRSNDERTRKECRNDKDRSSRQDLYERDDKSRIKEKDHSSRSKNRDLFHSGEDSRERDQRSTRDREDSKSRSRGKEQFRLRDFNDFKEQKYKSQTDQDKQFRDHRHKLKRDEGHSTTSERQRSRDKSERECNQSTEDEKNRGRDVRSKIQLDKESVNSKNEDQSIEHKKIVEQVDLMSENFNAEIALKMPAHKVKLPVPDAKIFDNLDAYALKSFPSKKPSKSEPTHLDLLRNQQAIKERMKEKLSELNLLKPKKTDTQITPKTVISLMKDDKGLGQFLNKRLRIFMRRRLKSKHPCEQYACLFGQLMFFDRHWNLILSDVHETMQFIEYIGDEKRNEEKLLNQSSGKCKEERSIKRTNSKTTELQTDDDEFSLSTRLISSIDNRRLLIGKNLELDNPFRIKIRERNFPKLFIRGDSIIYISKV